MPSLFEILRLSYARMRAFLGKGARSGTSTATSIKQTSDNDSAQFTQARAFQQQGQLDKAEAIYRSLLQKHPQHFDLLHMLGVVLGQRNNLSAALTFIDQAITIKPDNASAHSSRGNCLKGLGKLEEALASYDQALTLQPVDADTLSNQGATLADLGRHTQALESYDRALAINPYHVQALDNRGATLLNLQRPVEALASYDRALAISPDSSVLHCHRSALCRKLNRLHEALTGYDRALFIQPDLVEALLGRSATIAELQRHKEALDDINKAISLDPHNAIAHYVRAITLGELGRHNCAIRSCEIAVQLNPKFVEAIHLHGNILFSLERHEEAIGSYDRALRLSPRSTDVLVSRAAALSNLRRYSDALKSCDQALSINPENADAHNYRGVTLIALARQKDALVSIDRALALEPSTAETHGYRAAALRELNRSDEALTSLDLAISIKPDYADFHNNRGMVLVKLNRPKEALYSYDRALALKPDYAVAHSNKIVCMNSIPEIGFAEYQEEMRRWYERHGKGLARMALQEHRPQTSSRRLVVGYVSSDFMRHSAAAAFGPVLRHHDKSKFEIVCYSGVVVEDDRTHEFKQLADRWHPVAGMTDAALSEKITADGIDILVDLSGHSGGNRLLTFARKPAPVQVTAWGYATGTGLPAIDYFFSDPVATPAEVRPLFAETVYDLPCFITFAPPAYAPPVSEAPVMRRDFITFGCLNGFHKVSKSNLELWAQILRAVPRSRLLLKDTALAMTSNQSMVRQIMAENGIDPERIELRGGSSHQDHLAAYGDIDIALDPFPHNGGITTWEALWMGVPVISKLGNSSSGRNGGAILSALGLHEWVVSEASDYVALAKDKAVRPNELARFRRKIRNIISNSPAGNPVLYTRAVENAYLQMWHDAVLATSRPAS